MRRSLTRHAIIIGPLTICWHDKWRNLYGLEVCAGRPTLIDLWL